MKQYDIVNATTRGYGESDGESGIFFGHFLIECHEQARMIPDHQSVTNRVIRTGEEMDHVCDTAPCGCQLNLTDLPRDVAAKVVLHLVRKRDVAALRACCRWTRALCDSDEVREPPFFIVVTCII